MYGCDVRITSQPVRSVEIIFVMAVCMSTFQIFPRCGLRNGMDHVAWVFVHANHVQINQRINQNEMKVIEGKPGFRKRLSNLVFIRLLLSVQG